MPEPLTYQIDVELLKRLMANVVERTVKKHMGVNLWTQTCCVCGGGRHGADLEQHLDGCAAMAVARELGWVGEGEISKAVH